MVGKIIAVEEHCVVPEVTRAWLQLPGLAHTPELGFGDGPVAARLRDLGRGRLADMDDQGVDVQVLSLTTPGVQNLPPAEAVRVARETNDTVARAVAENAERLQAFAALPTPDPAAAAAELERVVGRHGFRGAMLNGRTQTRNIDAPEFDDLYGVAERLKVPLYLHPQVPVQPVRDAYYGGFGDEFSAMFATYGIGWYYETGVQLLRLIFSGTFDRHPELQVIVGHWGEAVLFFLEYPARLAATGLALDRPLLDYFRQNVWVTGSGLLSDRYLAWTVELVGTDRMLYATDYPFVDTSGGRARDFLQQSTLSTNQQEAVGSSNWERLTGHLGVATPDRPSPQQREP